MQTGEALAIIGGSASLTTVLNFALAKWTEHRTVGRDKAHQALLVVEHLENYAFGCAGHAFGDYAVLVDGSPGGLVSQPPQFPPFSDQIRWQAIDLDLAEPARRFAADVELAIAAASAGFRRNPLEGHGTALYWCLQLGAEAVDQARTIRGRAGLGTLVLEGRHWDYPLFLRGEMEKLELRKAQIARHLDPPVAGRDA